MKIKLVNRTKFQNSNKRINIRKKYSDKASKLINFEDKIGLFSVS